MSRDSNHSFNANTRSQHGPNPGYGNGNHVPWCNAPISKTLWQCPCYELEHQTLWPATPGQQHDFIDVQSPAAVSVYAKEI